MTKPRLTIKSVLADRRVLLMLVFGFSSGLPFLLVFSTLSAWLRLAGVSRTEIGLLSYVALAYTFKFAWAPIVDAFDVPGLSRLLGRRRAWMVLAQLTVAAGLVGIALSDPAVSVTMTAAFALLVAFASATQDVVVDGWRIDAAPTERQGMMAAAYQLGYRLSLIAAGAGALYIADLAGWREAYLAMAALVAVGLVGTLVAPIVDRREGVEAPKGFTFAHAVVDPLRDLLDRKGWRIVLILLLVAFYRLPDFVAGVMANPLYVDMKFSMIEIANVSKLYGVWIGIAGAFAGGFALARFGLLPSLVFGALSSAGSNLMFAWLALRGYDLTLLTVSISIDNFAGGFAGTALIAYMSGLTGPGFAATQYALLSSLYALPGKIVGGLSGVMVDSFGYPTFFVLTSLVGIPVAILCLIVGREGARPEEPAAEPAGARA
ncbi:AmpG family muropeptide MFS transporter [Salinarimonas soli]|uniref:AmpG family muropeptide MFS transporter n=1 Tax=Salinarimonas soli TaxID=1638099 RepID=A0A5B2V7T7_9HYPH|nr:MFS transporter [Salinarimonas soli]KAA2235031.1 AmpG family muropeptide MFS transporter [Salinarimonas soli]